MTVERYKKAIKVAVAAITVQQSDTLERTFDGVFLHKEFFRRFSVSCLDPLCKIEKKRTDVPSYSIWLSSTQTQPSLC